MHTDIHLFKSRTPTTYPDRPTPRSVSIRVHPWFIEPMKRLMALKNGSGLGQHTGAPEPP